MRYWLMKSEPGAFSIDDLRHQKVAGWDGVRNYQARNHLRAMKKGDLAFFYHSSVKPSGIVGMMEVVREAYPDPTQFDSNNKHHDPDSPPGNPRWSQVDVKFLGAFSRMLSLDEIKRVSALKDMVLLKRGWLSVQPVTPAEWEIILNICHSRTPSAGIRPGSPLSRG
jgi:predicted RNA-binding protein with PUA-like domain